MSPLTPDGDLSELAALLATPPSPILQTPTTTDDTSLPDTSLDSGSSSGLALSSSSQSFVPRSKSDVPMFVPRPLHELLSRETSPDAYATISTRSRNMSISSDLSDDGFPSFQPFVTPPQADLSEDGIPAAYLLNDDFCYQYVGAVKSRPHPAACATRTPIPGSPTLLIPRLPTTGGLTPPTPPAGLLPSPFIDSAINTSVAERLAAQILGEQDDEPRGPTRPTSSRFAFRRNAPLIEPELEPIGSELKVKATEINVDTHQVQRGTEYRAFHHTSTRDEIFDPNSAFQHTRTPSDSLARWLGERTSRREELNNQPKTPAQVHLRSDSRNTDESGSSRTSKYSFATAFNQSGYGGHLSPPSNYRTPALALTTHALDLSYDSSGSGSAGHGGPIAPWGHFAVPGGTVDLRAIWDRPLPPQTSQPAMTPRSGQASAYGAVGTGRPDSTPLHPISSQSSGVIPSSDTASLLAASAFWPTPAQSAQALQYPRATQQYAQQQRGAPYASVSVYEGYPGMQEAPLTPGDWLCARMDCRFVNFARNVDCKSCGTRKMLDDLRSAQQLQQGPPLGSAGDWQCATCHFINWRRRTLCMKCFPDHPSNSDRSFNYPDPRSGSSATLAQAFARGTNLLSPSPDSASWYEGYARGWTVPSQ